MRMTKRDLGWHPTKKMNELDADRAAQELERLLLSAVGRDINDLMVLQEGFKDGHPQFRIVRTAPTGDSVN
jgi:hypothetical protein